MTKAERRTAIAVALAKIEETQKVCEEAFKELKAIEAKYFKDKATHYEVWMAEERARKLQSEFFAAKSEYNELTKYKAWKSVMKA